MSINLFNELDNLFKAGINDSHDPINANLPELFKRITSEYSEWYTRSCPICRFKFRDGDEVKICPKCERVYHEDSRYNLQCWSASFGKDAEECNYCKSGKIGKSDIKIEKKILSKGNKTLDGGMDELSKQFLLGLEREWKPYGNQDILVTRKSSPFLGLRCPICTFKIREGDQVIRFPCPNDKCNIYFHSDINRHLTCWDSWHGKRGKKYCPNCQASVNIEEIEEKKRTSTIRFIPANR